MIVTFRSGRNGVGETEEEEIVLSVASYSYIKVDSCSLVSLATVKVISGALGAEEEMQVNVMFISAEEGDIESSSSLTLYVSPPVVSSRVGLIVKSSTSGSSVKMSITCNR